MKICTKYVDLCCGFVCPQDSYHGIALGATGASWVSTRSAGEYVGGSGFLAGSRPFVRVPNPDTYRNLFGVDTGMLERGVLANCRAMGGYLADGIRKLMKPYPEIGDVRQLVLHIGVEFVRDPQSKEPLIEETAAIRKAGFGHGIIFGMGGARESVLKAKPPLIVAQDDCDEILDKLERSIRDVLRAESG